MNEMVENVIFSVEHEEAVTMPAVRNLMKLIN